MAATPGRSIRRVLRFGIALLWLCAAATAAARPPALAADHTLLVVRDMAAASNVLSDSLGFKVQSMGRFRDIGVENRVVYFQDGLFFELLAIYDETKATGTREARFLRTQEGALGLAFEAESAEQLAKGWRAQQIPFAGPRCTRPMRRPANGSGRRSPHKRRCRATMSSPSSTASPGRSCGSATRASLATRPGRIATPHNACARSGSRCVTPATRCAGCAASV